MQRGITPPTRQAWGRGRKSNPGQRLNLPRPTRADSAAGRRMTVGEVALARPRNLQPHRRMSLGIMAPLFHSGFPAVFSGMNWSKLKAQPELRNKPQRHPVAQASQPAVSQCFSLRIVELFAAFGPGGRSAGWKPAIQQVGNPALRRRRRSTSEFGLKAQENEQAQRHKADPPHCVRPARASLSFELLCPCFK